MHMYSSLLLLPAVLQLASAWRPKDAKCKDSDLCLTSFKWCENDKKDADCYFPKDVYRRKGHSSSGPRPALLWDKEYEITWTTKDDVDDSDRITIHWTFLDNHSNNDGSSWDWETNVTNSKKYTFKPSRDMFPNRAGNVSQIQAQGLATGLNRISIHHYTSDSPSSDNNANDQSDTFFLLPSSTTDLFDQIEEEDRERWLIRVIRWTCVGIVGGGVVAGLFTAVFCMFWARFVYRRHGEKGLQGKKWFTGV